MKRYTSAYVTDFGDIEHLTAVLGGAWTGDVLVDTNGNIEQTGHGCIDACPVQNPAPGEPCTINP